MTCLLLWIKYRFIRFANQRAKCSPSRIKWNVFENESHLLRQTQTLPPPNNQWAHSWVDVRRHISAVSASADMNRASLQTQSEAHSHRWGWQLAWGWRGGGLGGHRQIHSAYYKFPFLVKTQARMLLLFLVHPAPLPQVDALPHRITPASACKKGETTEPNRNLSSISPLFMPGFRTLGSLTKLQHLAVDGHNIREAGWWQCCPADPPHLNKPPLTHIKCNKSSGAWELGELRKRKSGQASSERIKKIGCANRAAQVLLCASVFINRREEESEPCTGEEGGERGESGAKHSEENHWVFLQVLLILEQRKRYFYKQGNIQDVSM